MPTLKAQANAPVCTYAAHDVIQFQIPDIVQTLATFSARVLRVKTTLKACVYMSLTIYFLTPALRT